MSERRACRVIDADRKSMRYRSQRDDDAELRSKLRELAQQRRRFGYRRLHILLRREGVVINRKKTQRLYCNRCFQATAVHGMSSPTLLAG
jgi:transposase InsO family protein